MENVVEKKEVKHICKTCGNYMRKNAKTGECMMTESTKKSKKVHDFVYRDHNWTCEKWVEEKGGE